MEFRIGVRFAAEARFAKIRRQRRRKEVIFAGGQLPRTQVVRGRTQVVAAAATRRDGFKFPTVSHRFLGVCPHSRTA